MSKLGNALSAIFGTAPWSAGDSSGFIAGDAFASGISSGVARDIVDGMSAGDLYATQSNLRTVVSFVARNGAQLGRHVFKKDANGRTRVENSPGAALMAKPNDYMTGFDLFNMLFTELALYDMAVWVPKLAADGWQIDPIPGEWIVGIVKGDAFRVAGYQVRYPDKANDTFVPAASTVVFRGYNPHGFKRGSSPVRSLRATLGEQVAAIDFRAQMWQRGGRVGMFLSRPKDAPEWSPAAKQKFIQNWRANWSGNGNNAGSTPLLEDGMTLQRVGFNAKEEQWLEAATLSLTTVAGAYHVPPAMVGVAGYNSFASVKEFRKMLYTETMGPSIAQVEETINTFLFPMIGEPKGNYLELNIQEKLQGDFEEQAAVIQSAVGGPWMTVNEARRRENLPDIDGGNELLAPLNMGAAGNNGPAADQPIDPAAADPAAADPTAPKALSVKAPATKDAQQELSDLLAKFFGRQERAVKALLDDPETQWWDQKKWNAELSALLLPSFLDISTGTAHQVAGAKGLNPDDYSVAQTKNFLDAVSDSRADLINATTRDQLAEAFLNTEVPQAVSASHVFTVAKEARASESATTLATFITAWATVEAAKQLVPPAKGPTKTWVSSGKPNSRHASMNGETVPIDAKFSNGADWPGDPVLGAGGVSNCLCGVDINYND